MSEPANLDAASVEAASVEVIEVGIAQLPTYERSVIGPRRPGDIVHSLHRGTSRVDEVLLGSRARAHIPWSDVAIVETDLDGTLPGRQRVHCTQWDARDGVVLVAPGPAAGHDQTDAKHRPEPGHAPALLLAEEVKGAAAAELRRVLRAAAYDIGNLVGRGELSYTDGHQALAEAAANHAAISDHPAQLIAATIANEMEYGIRIARFERQAPGHQHDASDRGVTR